MLMSLSEYVQITYRYLGTYIPIFITYRYRYTYIYYL